MKLNAIKQSAGSKNARPGQYNQFDCLALI